MTEGKYMDPKSKIEDSKAYYQGVREMLEGADMPEDVQKNAKPYAFALATAREHDSLPEHRGVQAGLLRMMIAHAIAQTPLKEATKEGSEPGDLYKKMFPPIQ